MGPKIHELRERWKGHQILSQAVFRFGRCECPQYGSFSRSLELFRNHGSHIFIVLMHIPVVGLVAKF